MYMRVVLINILVPQLGPSKQKFLAPPLHGHSIFCIKMLRYLVVVTIFSKLLRFQFFTSQNKIIKYQTRTNHN